MIIEAINSLTSQERILIISVLGILLGYLLYILSKKNFVKDNSGMSLTDAPVKKEQTYQVLVPIWQKILPNGKDEIGVYSFGNYTRIYGNHWNSKLDAPGHNLIRKIADTSYDIGEGEIVNYDTWIFDVREANVHSTLLSLFVDKSRIFNRVIIIADAKSLSDLKPILPENSKINNIKFIVE